MPPPDYEALLAQDAWLRRIARSLARDPDLADDLVQDAWVASLQQREGSRAWFVSVLRNLGASRFRTAASLRERARRAAEVAPEAHASTDEILADLELRGRVASELGALEEPYRTALHHRFMSDLSVKEIARRTGVSPSTASERITRGLARLKSRLDRAYGGDRRAWSALLLPMARPKGLAVLGLETLAMTTALKWTLAAAAACALWLTLTQLRSVSARPGESVSVQTGDPGTLQRARMETAEEEIASIDDQSLSAREASVAPAAADADAAAAASPTVGPRARIKARFRLPDGRPATGAEWRVRGWASHEEAVRIHGLPASWEPLLGTLDASGDVDVSFDAPSAFQFTFDVIRSGCVDATWRWHELVPEEFKDLGEVTLRAATTVTGVLVGPDGRPLPGGGWRVSANERFDRGRLPAERWDAASCSAAVDAETGSFALEGLPSGRIALSASSERFGVFEGPELDVPVAGTSGVLFPIDSLLREETSVIVDCDFALTLGSHSLHPQHVALLDGDGARVTASRHPSRSGSFLFEDVGAGPKQLVVDDPGFQRETRDGVRAGERVQLSLRGSASLALDVRGPDDEPVTLYAVEIEALRGMLGSRSYVHDGEQPLAEGLLSGMAPGSYRVFVRSSGRSAAADVVDLGAGETRPLALRLDGNATVRGRATFADGSPAFQVRARLVTAAEVDDGPDSFVVSEFGGGGVPQRNRYEVERRATDAEGRFALAAPGPGRYVVILGEDSSARSESGVFEVVEGEAPRPLELVAERPARIRGRIAVPAGLDLSGWRVAPFWPGMRMTFQSWFEPAIVNSEGSFELPELALGVFELHLLRPGSGMGYNQTSGAPSGGRLLAQFTLGDGEAVERTFPFPGALPSHVTFEVALSGAPDGPCRLQVDEPGVFRSSMTVSGTTSTLEPLLVDAGERTVTLHGVGWAWVSPAPIAIPEGATTTIPLDVRLIAKPVRLTASGVPAPGVSVRVQQVGARSMSLRLRSDAAGLLDLRLAAGTYDLSLSSLIAGEPLRVVRVEWPLADDEATLAVDGE